MSKNARLKREAKKFKDCETKPSNVIEYEQYKNRLTPLNESQRQFISSLSHDEMVIGAGAAGTGKTYIASRIAGQIYNKEKNCKRIILIRPNIEVGRSMGFLPGELEEKYAPYVTPFEKGLKEELGLKYENDLYKNIVPSPIAYMRGHTYDNCVMLIDEAQNLTIEETKMILTRIGTGTRVFITGDHSKAQNDLKAKENGLQWLIRQIRTQGMGIEVVDFKSDDCVRSPLCKNMLKLIDNEK
jgi:phosphate starvation-inducible PhoH-like protein